MRFIARTREKGDRTVGAQPGLTQETVTERLITEAEPALSALLNRTEDELYFELGTRLRAVAADPALGPDFGAEVLHRPWMGISTDLRELGRRVFQGWNEEAYALFCGDDSVDKRDRRELLEKLGITSARAGAFISALLVSQVGLAPAVAAVIAAILLRRFARRTHRDVCDFWKEQLDR